MSRARCFLASLALLASSATPAATPGVQCHVSYGGETRTLRAQPVASPYAVPTVQIGSYFLFRIVLQTTPRDTAAAKIYVYADHEDSPVIIQHSTHAWPLSNRPQFGFSGLQRVYEPVRDGELEYWCERI
ncbi:hypothetical protein [Uliginosibacterium sediminicola]|uniref:Uncharacterized protein n=1 Tax=Uliginosibacterium sediminicola TaxID=2024550 RepID=A0ABU9Z3J2_9RHOO